MITDAEQYQSALGLLQILEQRVQQAIVARRARLAKVIKLGSNDHLFWYVSTGNSDTANIQILQDAAFVATGIHVIGQELDGSQFLLNLQNGWPRRDATQTQNLPVFASGLPASAFRTQVSVSVPIDHFMPAYTSGNTVGIEPLNVDYWYQPIADWLIPRGDTIAITFERNSGHVDPVVVLSGRKVSS